jgi:hypothetical protein
MVELVMAEVICSDACVVFFLFFSFFSLSLSPEYVLEVIVVAC